MLTTVLDLGVVLAPLTSQVADLSRRLGVDEQAAAAAYWAHRDAWDAGGSDLAYWGAVAGELGLAMDEELAAELTRHDQGLWTTLRPDALAILVELHALGRPTALLSNAAASFGQTIAGSGWGQLLGARFISGELGMVKPDPAIFAHVEDALGLPGEQLAFVDDREVNVAAAAARGWQAHLWRSDADTRAWLVSLGILA